MAEKLNVAVIFGGVSNEHEISCLSAANVVSILDRDKYNVYVLGITRDGKWFLTDATPAQIRSGKWLDADSRNAFIAPDRGVRGIYVVGGKNIKIDVAFPILHGKNGEDGAAAALLKLAGIPQVTTTMTSAACSMDKVITKILCERAGISQAGWEMFYSSSLLKNVGGAADRVEAHFKYPVFVKPVSAGSSVGVVKCSNRATLEAGLLEAARHDFKVLVEEFIDGSEVEVAVIGNSEPTASLCGQIAPSREFYSYDSKYKDDSSELFIPAKISDEISDEVRNTAVKVYKTMECQGMARVDFFVCADGRVIFNELNTIPGFTDISMYPKLMAHSCCAGCELADRLISLALAEDRI